MKTILELETFSGADTVSKGKEILNNLPKGTNLIFLEGQVGAGKTTLVKGIAKAMGIFETVTSPTYGHKKEYPGLIHYDLFLTKKMRKKEIKSLISEDLEDNLVIIEWGEKIPKIDGSVTISIKSIDDKTRKIEMKSMEK